MSLNDSLNKQEILDLQKELKKYKKEHDLYIRIQSVLLVKSGETRKKVAEFNGVHRNTVGIWVQNYDEKGIDGLKSDYSNCGAESRLTNEQLMELYGILTDPEKHYTLKDARNIIKNKYGVKYSNKQVWVITRKK